MSDKCQCIGEWTAGCPLHDPDLLVTPPIPESLRERLAATLNELHSHARASKDGETMGHVDADAVLPLIEAELQALLAAQLQAAAKHVPELILQARIVVCSCGFTAQLVTKPGTFAEQWSAHILALTTADAMQALKERDAEIRALAIGDALKAAIALVNRKPITDPFIAVRHEVVELTAALKLRSISDRMKGQEDAGMCEGVTE